MIGLEGLIDGDRRVRCRFLEAESGEDLWELVRRV